jgi:hypothetical protein
LTRDDATQVLAYLKVSYPAAFRDMSKQTAEGMIALWQDMFSDTPLEKVMIAVKAHVKNSKFFPTVAEISEYINKLAEPDKLTADQAWQGIMKACYWLDVDSRDDIVTKFNALPEITKSILGNGHQLVIYANMYERELQEFEKPRFVRSFEARQKATEEFERLPESVRVQSLKLKGETMPLQITEKG